MVLIPLRIIRGFGIIYVGSALFVRCRQVTEPTP